MMSPPSITRRFSVLLLGTLVALAIGCWSIWQISFTSQLHALGESRFQFSLNTVRAALESGLRLGFNPADLPGAQLQIDQARAREQGILSIDIFDPQGRIVFTTDHSGVGVSVPEAWRTPCLARTSGAIWFSTDDNDNLQCAVLLNAYEQVSAAVLLRYRLPARMGVGGALPEHWGALLGSLALFLLLGSAAGWLIVRPVERHLDAQVRSLAGAELARDDDLVGPVASALQHLGQIQDDLHAIEAEADRIDHLDTR